jgi:hypothetical protein
MWTAVIKTSGKCDASNGISSSRASARQQLFSSTKRNWASRVDEVSDQPRASDPIHFDVFTSNPFHDCSTSLSGGEIA